MSAQSVCQAVNSIQVPRRLVTSAWGGTETTVIETSRALQAEGHPTRVFTSLAMSDQISECIGDIEVRRFPYVYPFLGLSREELCEMDRKGGNLVSLALLRALLREPGVNLLHAHSGKRLGGIVRTAARLRGIPYVVTLHGNVFDVPDEEKTDLVKPIRGKLEWGRPLGLMLGSRRVLDDAAAVICVGRSEYEAARDALPGQRVEFLPNGVNSQHFAKGDGSRFRARMAIPESAKVVLCVSRIDPQKNQLSLVESMPALLAAAPDAHLVLVGPVTRPAYLARVRSQIEALNLVSRVHVIEGLAPDDPSLVEAYHAADVFCLPSMHEPFGIVILEAWAAGLPVVASRVGGIPSFVADGDDGLLVPPGDVHALAQSLKAVLRNFGLGASLGDSGRRRACREFDWSVIADRVLALYRDILRRHR
ncbi:MAG: glycosyltransferase family 4 protein [Gammaproteobacteria bacterium]|nr:MAG: glycosyltransferase family 4 protein [Gammaproteobacteria bacterium]